MSTRHVIVGPCWSEIRRSVSGVAAARLSTDGHSVCTSCSRARVQAASASAYGGEPRPETSPLCPLEADLSFCCLAGWTTPQAESQQQNLAGQQRNIGQASIEIPIVHGAWGRRPGGAESAPSKFTLRAVGLTASAIRSGDGPVEGWSYLLWLQGILQPAPVALAVATIRGITALGDRFCGGRRADPPGGLG